MSEVKQGKIYESIIGIMTDIEAIGKDSKNQSQNWYFRGIDTVMNVLHPLLVKHKVFLTSQVLSAEQQDRTTKNGAVLIYSLLHIRYRLYADDGSYIETEAYGEGMDSGDKSSNKAMSIAMKYAILQMLCVPTEAVDPDLTRPEESGLAPGKTTTVDPKKDLKLSGSNWLASVISQIATSSKDELLIVKKSIDAEKDKSLQERARGQWYLRHIELSKTRDDLALLYENLVKETEDVKSLCREAFKAKKSEVVE